MTTTSKDNDTLREKIADIVFMAICSYSRNPHSAAQPQSREAADAILALPLAPGGRNGDR